MTPCDHHDHADQPAEPAIWRATASGGSIIGDFCTEHLGDGLDGFDGHVNLDRVEEG